MKILYISHEYWDRRLSYVDVLRSLGHDVTLLKIDKKREVGQIDVDKYDSDYDVVWLFSADYIRFGAISQSFLSAVKANGAMLVGSVIIAVDTPFDVWVEACRHFDVWFTGSQMVAGMARERGLNNVVIQPFGFDASEYYRMNLKPKWNITFMGSPQSLVSPEEDLRCELLNSLKSFKIRVFGNAEMRRRLDKSIKVTPFSTHKQQNMVYNRSRINLDIPYINSALPEYRGKNYPKNRLFEVPGSGGFLFEFSDPDFHYIMAPDVHYGSYDARNIFDKVEYYLSNEREREDIARAGHEHVIKHYQNIHCFKEMIRTLQEVRKSLSVSCGPNTGI
jgi:hypothetical protein